MCTKLPYQNPRIDECLRAKVKEINGIDGGRHYSTVASCCGHGKYPPTIVVRNKMDNGYIYEWFTMAPLDKPKKHRYYKRDPEGYYYIEKVESWRETFRLLDARERSIFNKIVTNEK